jgi:hypothetical protein
MVYEFDKRIEELKPEAIASLTCSELDVMTSRAPEVMLEKLERVRFFVTPAYMG